MFIMKYLQIFFCFLLYKFSYSQVETFSKIDSLNKGFLNIEVDKGISLNKIDNSSDSIANVTKVENKSINKIEDLCTKHPKISGFKIQIYTSKNRIEIETIQKDFNKKFPFISNKIDFIRPDYKLKAGEYLTKDAAKKELNQYKKIFPNAIVIIDEVFCKRVKF